MKRKNMNTESGSDGGSQSLKHMVTADAFNQN